MTTDNNHEYVGEVTTFFGMLTDDNSKKRFDEILIPKIQRDYAQGRSGRKLMRRRFLKRLWKAIDSDKSDGIELDFIYGQKQNATFLPIDGQQRLTTLFLLHLYLGKRAGKDTDFLKAFTYDTRDSSKEFCHRLLEIPGNEFKGIKAYITNQWWFTRRWSNDPTVSSMLVMLDDIDTHYSEKNPDGSDRWQQKDIAAVWYRLTTDSKIRFWKLTLDDLRTSDDLYIKMNSRGKPLTDFEHFKAEIESYLYNGSMAATEHKTGQFSLKIDTDWTNLLWQYRDKEADGEYRDEKNKNSKHYADNGLDLMFINIFRRFMIIEGTKKNYDYNTLERTDTLRLADIILKPEPELLSRFEKIMDFFVSLESVPSFFSNILTDRCDEQRIKDGIPANADNYRVYLQKPLEGNTDFLSRFTGTDKLNRASQLMLEAFLQYASAAQEVDYTSLREKIRIIRNLILNSPDELRADRFGTLLRRVDAIMSGETLNAETSGEFRQLQTVQEIAKLKYIDNNPSSEWTIKFAENHSVLRGNLSCYRDKDNILVELLPLHEALFHTDAEYDLIERYLLTIGDYAPTANSRKLYGGRHFENWRDDIFSHNNKVTPPILHKALRTLPDFTHETLKHHIDTWLSVQKEKGIYTWPYYMVCHAGMRHGESARYTKAADFRTYNYTMMNRNNYNGKHWNPYLFCLWRRMYDSGAKLADYNAPLIFEKEGITVRAYEESFEIIMSDDTRHIIKIPQTFIEDKETDTVDRIDFVQAELEKILNEAGHRES